MQQIFWKKRIVIKTYVLNFVLRNFFQAVKLESWLRPLSPKGRYAVGIFNKNVGGLLQTVNRTMSQLGLTDENGYTMKEIFTGISYGPYKLSDSLVIRIPPTNLFLSVATPVTEKELIVF